MSATPGPFNPGPALVEAVALQRQGRLREAEKIYARVLKAAPDHFDALNLLGTIKAQQGRLGEAQRLFGAAVKANPGAAAAWSNLGQALHALKKPAEALECLDKARALAPDDVNILDQHANALLDADRPRDALAEFQRVSWRASRSMSRRASIAVSPGPRSDFRNWRLPSSTPRLAPRPAIRGRITTAASRF